MTQPEKTVFISYRRKDISWALAVYQNLTAHGFDVFFDYKSIYSGDFDQIIISNIKARAHFLVILTPDSLDRCNEPGDWLRREIETAIGERRNIVPLFFEGFNFGTPSISEKLTGKLEALKRYNGLEVPTGYFEEAMERLRNKYLNITLDALLHPVSDEVRKVVREHQEAANIAIAQKKDGKDIPKASSPLQETASETGQATSPKTRRFVSCGLVGLAVLCIAGLIFGGYYAFQNIPVFQDLLATGTQPGNVAGTSTNPTQPETESVPPPVENTSIPFRVASLGQWGSEGDGNGQFRRPWGLAVNWSVGDVYVGDDGRNLIQVFSSSGEFLGNLPGKFYANFLALDSDGKVFALNYDPGNGQNNRIEVYYFGEQNMLNSFPLKGQSPRAIDADIYGENIYVTDISDQKVYRYGPEGQVLSEWGSQGSGNGQFLSPWGIAVDRYQTGRIYVADTGNNRIQVFTSDGKFIDSWGAKGTGNGQFDSPIDVAVDTSHGYVYVLDSNNARVQVFTPEGEFLGKWGTVGRREGEFLDPYGIAIDGDDTVYVLDSGNFRVQSFRVSYVP